MVDNLLSSDDIHYMLGALRTLGLNVEEHKAKQQAIVEGCGGLFPVAKEGEDEIQLFLGNAGTAMRPLTAAVVAAGGDGRFVNPFPLMPHLQFWLFIYFPLVSCPIVFLRFSLYLKISTLQLKFPWVFVTVTPFLKEFHLLLLIVEGCGLACLIHHRLFNPPQPISINLEEIIIPDSLLENSLSVSKSA